MCKQLELCTKNKNSERETEFSYIPDVLRDEKKLAKANETEVLRAILGKSVKPKIINLALLFLANTDAGYVNFLSLEGIGERGAAILTAIKHVRETIQEYEPTVRFSTEAIKHFYEFMHKDREHFVAVFLGVTSRVLGKKVISIGSVNQTIVHPREVFNRAIALRATSIILGHNHPSGNVQPSPEDIVTTKRIGACGKIIGIGLTDHIIFSNRGTYYSFREHDKI